MRENLEHLHRHAQHALEDFEALTDLMTLRKHGAREELVHSISHHLRHVVYRSGLESRENSP